jgi:hypothetical protein
VTFEPGFHPFPLQSEEPNRGGQKPPSLARRQIGGLTRLRRPRAAFGKAPGTPLASREPLVARLAAIIDAGRLCLGMVREHR